VPDFALSSSLGRVKVFFPASRIGRVIDSVRRMRRGAVGRLPAREARNAQDEGSRLKARRLAEDAVAALAPLGPGGARLEALAWQLLDRDR